MGDIFFQYFYFDTEDINDVKCILNYLKQKFDLSIILRLQDINYRMFKSYIRPLTFLTDRDFFQLPFINFSIEGIPYQFIPLTSYRQMVRNDVYVLGHIVGKNKQPDNLIIESVYGRIKNDEGHLESLLENAILEQIVPTIVNFIESNYIKHKNPERTKIALNINNYNLSFLICNKDINLSNFNSSSNNTNEEWTMHYGALSKNKNCFGLICLEGDPVSQKMDKLKFIKLNNGKKIEIIKKYGDQFYIG